MRIALFHPPDMPESFRVYCENVSRELVALGSSVTPFEDPERIPDADVIWDPRSGGGNQPIAALCGRTQPLVVTLHGVAPMAIPLREYFPTWRKRVKGAYSNYAKRRAWKRCRGTYAAVITVSQYSKSEILKHLPIEPDWVVPCYNAVDHALFKPSATGLAAGYFLHISNDEPRKNIDRICEAYLSLPVEGRPPLVLKLPAGNARVSHDGIEVIKERLSDAELAQLYQGAVGFLFPSLFEGFGLPILEAMACGCPVITSNDNACAEVAANAALLVDPRSTSALRAAMASLLAEQEVRRGFSQKGIARAAEFSWRAAAGCHLAVFERAVQEWT